MKPSPFSISNVNLFIRFRVLFNSRFYYPVFTIMFLDFGLTLEEFAILNAVWAASIVMLEVPSGALADVVGRRTLLVWAGALMVVEIALLCIVPLGNHTLVFAAFVVNRVLSGAAEAAASGADEAIAYDSLKAHGDPDDWGRVLEKQMRMKSVFYIAAMTMGALVYDPEVMQRLVDFSGLDLVMAQEITLRFPLYLTLIIAVLTFYTTLKMTDPGEETRECRDVRKCGASVFEAFKLTLHAGKWIWQTPAALGIILAGLVFDHVIRMAITLNSQYFRLIELPEASFGFIGAGLSLLGLFIPRLALRLAGTYSLRFNTCLAGAMTLIGFVGLTFFWPVIGLAPMVLLHAAMMMITFFVSHYLNKTTDSSQRATVLSFKGLCFNLSYGLIGILYSVLIGVTKNRITTTQPELYGDGLNNMAFMSAMDWFPYYFILTFVVLFLVTRGMGKK